MTKPSYEERELGDARIALDAEYDAALKEYNSRPLHAGLFPSRRQWLETRALELHAEVLRVRGLLQRIYALAVSPEVEDGAHDSCRRIARIAFGEGLAQGAESADIGKLDSVDKSGVEMGKVNRVDEQGGAND